MWNKNNRDEFLSCIADLVDQPDVLAMHDIKQHANGVSCLDHCIFVSYLSFIICKRLKIDYRSAARAALLHDLYLCDWSTTDIGIWERLLIHPVMALGNASCHGLSELEQDIILKHMWPITLRSIPRHKESVVVNFADKLCTSAELLRIYGLINAGEMLIDFNRRRVANI